MYKHQMYFSHSKIKESSSNIEQKQKSTDYLWKLYYHSSQNIRKINYGKGTKTLMYPLFSWNNIVS